MGMQQCMQCPLPDLEIFFQYLIGHVDRLCELHRDAQSK